EAEVGAIPRGARVTFTVPAYPIETFTGTVGRVAHSMDAKTRSMPVELDVANPNGRLAAGMYPSVKWPVRGSQKVLLVPLTSILNAKGIYVAEEGAYKFVMPREAATIVWDYQSLSPNIGLNSWATFSAGVHREAMLTGQLLLLGDEVNEVLGAALDNGLEITG